MGWGWFLIGMQAGFYFFVPANIKRAFYFGTILLGSLIYSKVKIRLWLSRQNLKGW